MINDGAIAKSGGVALVSFNGGITWQKVSGYL
jgi:hypothetical protein